MPSLRAIRRRIRSIQNIAKVTKAMEMIAASKMRRAQEQALAGRPYEDKLVQVIADLSAALPRQEDIHPLLTHHPEVKRVEIIQITTDRGLCGALNSNIFRRTGSFILEQSAPVTAIAVGRKGRDWLSRSGQTLRAEFTGLPDRPGILDIAPIARLVVDDYSSGYADAVYLIYPQLVSTMTQRPMVRSLIPVEATAFPPGQNLEYIFEPHPSFVLAQLLPRYIEMEIYHALLEARACEHSARMVAMRNATDNASDLTKDLTLVFNKARQESITNELLDMMGTKVALE